MKKSVLLTTSAFFVALGCAAHAETFGVVNQAALSYQSILSTMGASGGHGGLEWQVAPSHSELFGFGVRATAGGYLSDNLALGMIIDLGEHRGEYLANAGLRLSDTMRVIGSFGLLKESEEFVLGSGRDDVSQLQYGLSLKGDYDAGVVRGFEINAYGTDASSDTDLVETGDLTGIQMMTQLQPAIGTNIRLGAGYEQVTWAGGTKNEGFTAQVLGLHQLSDTVALSFEAKSAETETVYGLGLGYDLSTAEVQNSHVSVTLTHIEGKHGISDDTRVALNWTVGFGAGSGGAASSASRMGSMARADLLAEVMTRPAFLPERVIARALTADGAIRACSDAGVLLFDFSTYENDYFYTDPEGAFVAVRGTPEETTLTIDGETLTASGTEPFGTIYYTELGFLPSYVVDQQYTLTIGGISCLVIAKEFPLG